MVGSAKEVVGEPSTERLYITAVHIPAWVAAENNERVRRFGDNPLPAAMEIQYGLDLMLSSVSAATYAGIWTAVM